MSRYFEKYIHCFFMIAKSIKTSKGKHYPLKNLIKMCNLDMIPGLGLIPFFQNSDGSETI